jgi:hypothetical protein
MASKLHPHKSHAYTSQVGIVNYGSFRVRQLPNRLQFYLTIHKEYFRWQESTPPSHQKQIFTELVRDWHDMALNRDPRDMDDNELRGFIFLTGLCGTLYCDYICDDEEEENQLLAIVGYRYRCSIEMLKHFQDSFRTPGLDRWIYHLLRPEDELSPNPVETTVINSQRKDYWNWWNTKRNNEGNAQNCTNWPTKLDHPLAAKRRLHDQKTDTSANVEKEKWEPK